MTKDQAIEQAIARMRAAWPAQRWDEATLREWRRALGRAAHSPEALEAAVDWAIDEHSERFPPPIGALVGKLRGTAKPGGGGGTGQQKVEFLQAVPGPNDPPGTVRWIVQREDGTRIPAGARAVDDLDPRRLEAVPEDWRAMVPSE